MEWPRYPTAAKQDRRLVKPRETRQTIKVNARMKSADGWQDVAIQNVSAHGMRISVAMPPRRGAYIEVRRASQIIVARAMWVQGNDCGLRTQDQVDIPALINPAAARAEAVIDAAHADRRRQPRADEVAAASERHARSLQFLVLGAAILLAAGCAAWMVGDVLRRPFAAVSAAMGGQPT